MKVAPHQEKFLETIAQQGVEYAGTHWALGTILLKAAQIQLFTEDPDEFAAEYLNVSKAHLLEWQDFISSWQCVGETNSGARCKATASNGFRVDKPKQFLSSNPDCYCTKHKSQSCE